MPAYNAAETLPKCLDALRASVGETTELVVVDDGSTDDTHVVATAHGARVVRRPAPGGPAAARNAGVRGTDGAILIFIDADVLVAGDTIARARETLDRSPELAGVFGSYDAYPTAPGIVSQFRNLLHHYVHQHGNPEAFTFWAGCGALRRSAFLSVGGFDERGGRDAIEDVELGYRLHAAGHRVRLDRALLCTHMKRWTLGSMLRDDLLRRAIPWARLVLRAGTAPQDLNLAASQRWSVALTALLLGALLLFPWAAARWTIAAALAGIVVANRGFYAFLRRERGLGMAVACIPLHVLHFACGGLGFAWAYVETWLPRGRTGDVAA